MAEQFAMAHVMGAQNAAEGMLAVVLINEVGLVKAESNYHIMMGRISKKAHAVLADFVRAGGTYRIIDRSPEQAVMFASKDGTQGEYTFTWEQALQEPFVYAGGIGTQQYQLTLPVADRALKAKYATPRSRMQMLWARLISDTCQALCPEANDGMYPPEVVADFEEIDDVDDNKKGDVVIDVAEATERAEAVAPDVVIDYTLCPFPDGNGINQSWDTYTTDRLELAIACKDVLMTVTHKAAIRLVINSRKETS